MKLPARAPWDFPTRAFHWSLVALAVFSFTTGKAGGAWLEWHMKSGYAILALLLFRIAWGFAGSENARFAAFVRGPRAAIAHGRAMLRGSRDYPPGHNPLGAWMVLVLLAALLLQAATGLFANDESAHEGPLAARVSNAVVDRMSGIHSFNEWVLVGAVVVHVAAVAFYQWRLKIDLIRPMLLGPVRAPESARAAAWLALAAFAVYALVVLLPK